MSEEVDRVEAEVNVADLNIFAPRAGGSLRGRLWATDPSLMALEEAATLVAEAPRVIAWISAIQAAAVERVRESIAEAPLDAREGQPDRLDGEVAHALAVTEIATLQETSEAAAARLVNLSRELSTTHVAAMEALESGDVSEPHVRIIVDQAASLPEESREAYGIEALRISRTRSGRLRTPAEFRRAARDLREKMHPHSITVRRRSAAQERGVWTRPEDDGMLMLSALLPAETGLALYRRVDALARSQHAADDEHRTLPQLRADALLQLGLGAPGTESTRAATTAGPGAAGSTAIESLESSGEPSPVAPVAEDFSSSIRAEIVVHLPAAVLLGSGTDAGEHTGEGTCYLDGYGVIDADTARRLAAAAPTWHRLFTDTDGTPLSLGRTIYRPPEPLRRFLRYRDGTCRFPGCLRPAESPELDHTHEWQDGGGTDADNLAHLCRRHHALKSLALIKVRQVAAPADPSTRSGQTPERTETVPAQTLPTATVPTGTMVWTTMLAVERTTSPADRDRMLGYREPRAG